ncbi:MAG: acetyl-CoA carboxylase, carboxyltransferase subunit beta [Planctomycetota bacterium]|nr:acetyl-CoA carboxylase, carboxyltransferase subunit beta [Planctomycetota bacterium]MCX8039664.1 acetyl-CoA carboxylase, carboxyltransferase subunit beta [Planctomycetota bacterium]MDW8372242.1 acetyl-CoA carboxylase, carboxyltransferase subunit beta [Planctomycetota bacterium]
MVLDRLRRGAFARDPKKIPDGLWEKCPGCQKTVFKRLVEERLDTCPECNYHFKMGARRRIATLIDDGTWQEWDAEMSSADPLGFVDSRPYPERIAQQQAKTGLKDAVLTGRGRLSGIDVALGVMDFNFNGGSMGSVVGEKIARLFERARELRIPAIVVSASGGARMQEGVVSLMQMAKTSAAAARLREARVPFISVLTNPTMAGVMASFASLGDIIVAEPKAMIGFTGARVIQETIKQELPEGFQTSEFLLAHGQIDLIVARQDLKAELARLLAYLKPAPSARGAHA